MPISLMRNGLTAENSIFGQKPSINVSRSRFNLGRLNVFTADFGMIIPVDLFPTLPGDTFDLSCNYKIDFRPMLVPTLTPYKVKIHYYYCPNEALWTGWESFITKGRSGSLALSVPTIDFNSLSIGSPDSSGSTYNFPSLPGLTDDNFFTNESSDWFSTGSFYPLVSCSLASYILGNVPYDTTSSVGNVGYYHYLPYGPQVTNSSSSNYWYLKPTGYLMPVANALPFLMYQKIYRSNYLDPNLMANGTVESPVWFPDDIDSSHWRLDYAAGNLFGTYRTFFVPTTISDNPSTIRANFVPQPQLVGEDDGDNCVNLTQLRYATYNNDMFTTALPFLQRGPQTSLDLQIDSPDATFTGVLSGEIPVVFGATLDSGEIPAYGFIVQSSTPSSGDPLNTNFTGYSSANTTNPVYQVREAYSIPSVTSGRYINPATVNLSSGSVSGSVSLGAISAAFTAQRLRDLIAVSVWQERNALTNGSYGQFVKVHFDRYPNNTWFEPQYIGGTSSVFDVNSILQTSQSDIAGSYGALGSPGGLGGSSGRDSIGRFTAPDFGFIMAVMMVVPDNIYPNGAEHWTFDVNPDDYFMPEFERLSYQPILNKQLHVSGESDSDDGLFGYSNRYVYLKQRDSIARGRIALPSSMDSYYSAYMQKREFSDTPVLSQQFVTVYPPNLDRSFLAYPGEPAMIVQFYSGVNAVRPMSYISQPNTFGF